MPHADKAPHARPDFRQFKNAFLFGIFFVFFMGGFVESVDGHYMLCYILEKEHNAAAEYDLMYSKSTQIEQMY